MVQKRRYLIHLNKSSDHLSRLEDAFPWSASDRSCSVVESRRHALAKQSRGGNLDLYAVILLELREASREEATRILEVILNSLFLLLTNHYQNL